MKRLILAAAAAAFFAASASAADPFAAVYGNTVTLTMADGAKAIVYINADKSWEQRVGDRVVRGTYAWKDATHACFTATDPAPQDPAHATSCNEYTGEHKAGDSWTLQGGDGKPVTIAITAGR